MLKKNYYKTITESIVNAYHDNNLDSAMDDGHEMENMGKKIVAIITADPDRDLDWQSEYEPFGQTELTADDEAECCEFGGIDHDVCPSCGTDVNGYIVCDEEDDDDENDDLEDLMIGGEVNDFDGGIATREDSEEMEIKDILMDILDELKSDNSDDEEEIEDEDVEVEENSMFDASSENDEDEDIEEEDDDEDEDSYSLEPDSDWASDEEIEDEDSDEEEDDDKVEEEDFEDIAEEDSEITEEQFA